MENMERGSRKIVDVFIDSDTDSDTESHTGSEGAGSEEAGSEGTGSEGAMREEEEGSDLEMARVHSMVEGGVQPTLEEESDSEMEYEEPSYRASPIKSKHSVIAVSCCCFFVLFVLFFNLNTRHE